MLIKIINVDKNNKPVYYIFSVNVANIYYIHSVCWNPPLRFFFFFLFSCLCRDVFQTLKIQLSENRVPAAIYL